MVFVCLCVYVMAWMCCLFIDFVGLICVCGSGSFVFVASGVCVLSVVCCVAGWCFIGWSCVHVLLLF